MKLYRDYIKRLIDFTGAATLICLLSPVFLLCYVMIRKNMGSPVLFTQLRVGKGERIFKIYKFRSMTSEKDAAGELLPDSKRITKLGIFLRKTSMDELPQFFNVLKGDMSFIGPRPLLPRYLDWYTDREKLRHTVNAGITGLAQVSGRTDISWDRKLELDAQYSESVSFLLDVKIIFLTLKKVLLRENAHAVVESDPLDIERNKKINKK